MFSSLLTGGSARPAACAAPSESPPVVAPALPILRAPQPPAAAVQVEVSQTAAGIVIRVKGEARVECAGALLDGLLAPGRRSAVVTLDLSELRSISPLALGVLAAYRRSVVRTGGRVRLVGVLQPAVKESVMRAELFDLFETSAAGPIPPRHPKGVEIDMMDIILSTPVFYLYLVLVLVLLITALWTRQTGPPVSEPCAAGPTTGRLSATLRWQHVATSTAPPCGGLPRIFSATARPFPDLQATLSASYAAKLEQAIRTIRVGPGRPVRFDRP